MNYSNYLTEKTLGIFLQENYDTEFIFNRKDRNLQRYKFSITQKFTLLNK